MSLKRNELWGQTANNQKFRALQIPPKHFDFGLQNTKSE